jgi:IS30 family transposase
MKNESIQDNHRQVILDGISQNIGYTELASRLGVSRKEVIREVKTLRRRRDADLFEARRAARGRVDEEKLSASRRRDERFFRMAGMTIHEKSFQNMVQFYKPEILSILESENKEAAVSEIPQSVRKILRKYDILTSRSVPEVSQRAQNQL